MEKKKISTLTLCELGILFALVIVLQSISSIGVVTLCLCLVPITLGAMTIDWRGGAILGFTFGVVALFWGIVGKDVFTLYLFQANPVMTILICIVKGTLCGIAPALIWKLLKDKNAILASVVASIITPVVNTGIFALGALLIKKDVIGVANTLGIQFDNFFTLLFGVLITTNFLIELVINIVCSPALCKVTQVVEKNFKKS
ncbi:MAG: ECF transporter S component [Ruminococcaceae bacterium]|nr:ECF transporter S component [Oscillospiraceae bacterium]